MGIVLTSIAIVLTAIGIVSTSIESLSTSIEISSRSIEIVLTSIGIALTSIESQSIAWKTDATAAGIASGETPRRAGATATDSSPMRNRRTPFTRAEQASE